MGSGWFLKKFRPLRTVPAGTELGIWWWWDCFAVVAAAAGGGLAVGLGGGGGGVRVEGVWEKARVV